MICHVHAIITADQNKDTYQEESNQIFPGISVFHTVGQQRQGKQNTDNGHVAAGPALEAVIAAGQMGDHLPPVTVSGSGIVKRQKILWARTGTDLFKPLHHSIRRNGRKQKTSYDRDQFIRIRIIQKPDDHKRCYGIQYCPEQPAGSGSQER